ncbi:hypothetical protein JCM11641_000277 [Rhodosporidiobolus odoratus]
MASNIVSTTPSHHSAIHSRRALGEQSGMARAPGTPVGRLLAAEGLPVRSPRRVRQKSWQQKVQDWPSNAVLSLETSIQLLSLDPAGLPLTFVQFSASLSAKVVSSPFALLDCITG